MDVAEGGVLAHLLDEASAALLEVEAGRSSGNRRLSCLLAMGISEELMQSSYNFSLVRNTKAVDDEARHGRRRGCVLAHLLDEASAALLEVEAGRSLAM
ncbi:uncharacterized protein A4U43_C05F2430 [Asparagus officinalis]|uniref:Uncharacterized protein n=1 Tax=Asparagus officinalis TaxID=4686 RepID=A0A5P1ENT0_ASPOF|nr:uncharacterized protein A4U43_C05F2430 [Asparagus officinalis]